MNFKNPNTIYKFHCKLIKHNIFEDTYDKCVNTDTTFICNKLGMEDASFNQQIKITDFFQLLFIYFISLALFTFIISRI